MLRIDEVAEATGYRAPEGDYDTIGGLVLHELGHIPVEGESVDLRAFNPAAPYDDPIRWRATVTRMDGRRIDLLDLVELGHHIPGPRKRPPISDLLGVLLTVLLLAANTFFVGSEFALISARRDRLEALAETGKHSALTVIRAGENLSLILAGAQPDLDASRPPVHRVLQLVRQHHAASDGRAGQKTSSTSPSPPSSCPK